MDIVFFPCGQNKIQKILDQLPGMQLSNQPNQPKNIKPGFAGLEQAINSVKGFMFDKGIDPPSVYFRKRLINTETKIRTIQEFIMLFGIIKDPAFQKMYDETNNRVYQAFSGVDYSITNKTLQRADGTPMSATWASTYKTWMTAYLVDIAAPAWTWASSTRDDLETQLSADTTTDPATKATLLKQLADIKSAPGFSQSYFQCDFGLTWQPGRLNIRDLQGFDSHMKRDGTCSLSSPSQSLSFTTNSTTTESTSIPVSVSVPSTTITTSYVGSSSGTTSPSSPTPNTPTTSACSGNQIEGDCNEVSYPSGAPYSGSQSPVCQQVDSTVDIYLRVNSVKAKQAAADYCNALARNQVVLDAQATAPKSYIVPDAAENGGQLILSVIFDNSSCPTGSSQTTLDFTK